MPWENVIVDGRGDGHKAKISREGQLNVVVHPHPPRDEQIAADPFRSYFVDDAGSNDMQVVGSLASPEVFSITAQDDYDIYVNSVNIVIADAGAQLNEFGSITALTNGVRMIWETQERGEVEIHEGLKSNFDFVRLAGGQPAFGSGASAFRANNVSGTSEAYFINFDIEEVFGLPWGFRLRMGTKDRVSFIVRDDTTGVDQFDAIAYGIRF